jgi:predicted anti-sigma-YlaC factor YlaD
VDVRCSLARESLSAWADGEAAAAKPLEVSRHLATCRRCTAFAERLGGLGELTSALLRATGDRPPTVTVAADRVAVTPFRSHPLLGLRLALAVVSVAELAGAFGLLAADHGYGGEDHAGHESLSFTVALCAGLLWIAWRPVYARGYLPLVGAVAVLLGLTGTLDVVHGHAAPAEELPHLAFLVAFALLWVLARPASGRTTTTRWARRRTWPAGRRLRVVRGSLRAVAAVGVPVPGLYGAAIRATGAAPAEGVPRTRAGSRGDPARGRAWSG